MEQDEQRTEWKRNWCFESFWGVPGEEEENFGLKNYETYKKFGFDEMNKFNQMEKEMGAVISYSEGEASGEISKIFDKSIFEEK